MFCALHSLTLTRAMASPGAYSAFTHSVFTTLVSCGLVGSASAKAYAVPTPFALR